MVPVLAPVLHLIAEYVALCPYGLAPDRPVFVGAKGGPLSPRIIQLVMERLRGALNLRDAPCATAFLRHPPLGTRRRFARDPGTARACVAVDHTDLHRHRHRAAARSLPQRPPARLKKQKS